MKARVAYLKRQDDGSVSNDGMELDPNFDNMEHVPRIGETVVIPEWMREKLQPDIDIQALRAKRFTVVGVEHRWDSLSGPLLHIYISTLEGSPIIELPLQEI